MIKSCEECPLDKWSDSKECKMMFAYRKAIYDFVSKCDEKFGYRLKGIDEIAEQLKGGTE